MYGHHSWALSPCGVTPESVPKAILTPAWLEPKGGYGPAGVQLRAVTDGADYLLTGGKQHVLFASAATRLLVPVRTGEGEQDLALLLVDHYVPHLMLLMG